MNNSIPKLYQLSNQVKYLMTAFLLVLITGVSVGLIYVMETTSFSMKGTNEHYAGSKMTDELDIPEKYPKNFEGMLLITHTHLISFAFIFLAMGAIFLMNTVITGDWKTFLIVEPFLSVLGTFGSIWGIRYLSEFFSLTVMIFGLLTYLTFYFMAGILLYELLFKKNINLP